MTAPDTDISRALHQHNDRGHVDTSKVPHDAGFYVVKCPKCGRESVTAARKFKKCPYCPHHINCKKAERKRI